MLKERQRKRFKSPIYVLPDDTLRVAITGRDGRTEIHSEKIKRDMVIDTIVTFDVVGEFGLKEGVGAVFGRTDG